MSSIESLLCFYSSLVEEMFELGICDLLGIIVIKVGSKAVVLFFRHNIAGISHVFYFLAFSYSFTFKFVSKSDSLGGKTGLLI